VLWLRRRSSAWPMSRSRGRRRSDNELSFATCPGCMIASLRERVRQWWLARDLLLVNFGSGPGRVALVMLLRRQVADVICDASRVTFGVRVPEGWRFTVYADSPSCSATIAQDLERRRRHILEPIGEVLCMAHYRAKDSIPDSLPSWIGGDIALTRVPQDRYWRHGNGAWIHKNLQN